MAYTFNRVILMGRLTRDVELRYTPQGTPIAKFGLAVNHNYTAKTGERKEQVTFVDIKAWTRTAEICHQYLKKGSPVLLEGRLELESWEAPDGQKRQKLGVVADFVQFLGGRNEGGAGDFAPPPAASAGEAPPPPSESPAGPPAAAGADAQADETLPF